MFTKKELESKTLSELLRIYVQADKRADSHNQINYFKMVEKHILDTFDKKPESLQKQNTDFDKMIKECVDIAEELNRDSDAFLRRQ